MDKRNFIYTILSLLTISSAAALFYFWQRLLTNPFAIVFWEDQTFLASALFFTASAIVFFSFNSLFNLLIKNQTVRLVSYTLTALVFGGFTLLGPAQLSSGSELRLLATTFVSVLALLLVLVYFSYSTQKEIEQHIEFKAGHILGPRLGFFITALGFILAGQFFLALEQNLSSFKFQIPEAIFNQVFELTEEVMSGQLNPGAFLGGEVQGELDQTLLQQLPPEMVELIPLIKEDRLPPEIKEEIKRQLPPNLNYEQFKQMVQNIPVDEQGQITAHPDSETFRTDFLSPVKNQVQQKVNELIEPYRPYLPFVLTVLFFLILKSFGFIIDWLAVLLLFVWIGLLKLSGMVEEKAIQVEAKRLELKE